jgi:hypothetical protein
LLTVSLFVDCLKKEELVSGVFFGGAILSAFLPQIALAETVRDKKGDRLLIRKASAPLAAHRV